jgi:NAD(P)-dependent dehydrogenase (short-subunit alcohol dehydrogenase family)
VDVTNADSLREPFRRAAELKDRLDGLVAAAGIQYEAPALEYTAEDCRRILDVNVGRLSCVRVCSLVFLGLRLMTGYGCIFECQGCGSGNDSNEIRGEYYSHCKYVCVSREQRS